MDQHNHGKELSAAGLLITLGIIFGDIGTSPLYVFNAILLHQTISSTLIYGGISAIFWTLTLQTTLKYVFLTLRADNKGEGGIFSLYALVRRTRVKWLLFPAIIGGCMLMADGAITPPITISAAVEGLKILQPDIPTIPIVLTIITCLFIIQQFGTDLVGKFFGPVMLTWFLMLAILGLSQIADDANILRAIDPYYAWAMLTQHPDGFWLLGAVFLCTTGAEALYSDLGHCGKANIRISWIFVKICLLLNYFGQGAFLLKHNGETMAVMKGNSVFFSIIPEWFLIPGVVIATCAAIIASQAMISGSFTLINEAIRLNLWPKVKVVYPTNLRGQIYIPSVNWLLYSGCVGIILYFREATKMEAAYGLAIITTMMMTTTLLGFYLTLKRYPRLAVFVTITSFLCIELSFFIANLEKVPHGGWVAILMGSILFIIMFSWYRARKIKNRYIEFDKLDPYLPILTELSNDLTIPKYATHLVYLTSADRREEIENKVLYSILQKQPKRADIYWFIHVDVVDEPYRMDYEVHQLANQDVIRVDFMLGFRIAPRINLFFRKVVEDMVRTKEVDITSRYESLHKNKVIGDFRFVVIEKYLSYENELPFYEKLMLDLYLILKHISLSEEAAFGLDTSSVIVEKAPLFMSPAADKIDLHRIT